MINEVDEALRSLVRAEVLTGTDVEIVFDAPTREWASRRNTPTVNLYLYDIREDTKRRSTGMIERRDARGVVEERQALPRHFKLSYLVTAWTQRPEDEHRLLTGVLACFIRYDVLPPSCLPPLLAESAFPIGVHVAYPPPENRQVSDVWTSLGGDLKPSLDLVVTLPIQPARLYEIAQAVMAPLRLRTSGAEGDGLDDGVRHLREGRFGFEPASRPGRPGSSGGSRRPAAGDS